MKNIGNHQKRIMLLKITVVHSIETWSMDSLDLNDHGQKNDNGFRYKLVGLGKSSKYGRTVPLKKNAQTKKTFF